MKRTLSASLLAFTTATTASATLLAHYDFTDGNLLDNEAGPAYTLAEIATGTGNVEINPDGSAHFPGLEGANSAHLTVEGPGGSTDWTVSFWWKTDSMDQGGFQGLVSSGVSSSENFSWQVGNNGDDMRLVTRTTVANPNISFLDSTLSTDTWYHTVVRKSSTGDQTQFYTTELGAGTVNLIGGQANNPGGIFDFTLGANRNADGFFRMDMANVKIYNDSGTDLNTLLAEGPQLSVAVPEPGTGVLVALGLAMVATLRRRR